jgi:plasmid segregation protein ParM
MEHVEHEILGVDAANYEVKVASAKGVDSFLSDLGPYRERRIQTTYNDADDMIFEYNGRKGFAGTLARMEAEAGGSIMGMSKAHYDAKIRTLLAIHRNSNAEKILLVTGQPIETHTEEEKQAIKEMLLGEHTLTVNGTEKTFEIKRVEVAAEGAAVHFLNPELKTKRVIDVGSGTVNFATIIDGHSKDKGSGSIDFGVNSTAIDDLWEIARGIAARTSRTWNRNDYVEVVGGVAESIIEHIQEFYPNAVVIKPKIKVKQKEKEVAPKYANAVAYLEIARMLYV